MIACLPLPTMDPVPRVRLTISVVPAAARSLTVECIARSGVRRVRQAVEAVATNPFTVTDYAAPWNEDLVYRVTFYDAVGNTTGTQDYGFTRLVFHGTVLHQPLDPSRCVAVEAMVATARTVQMSRFGDHVSPGGYGLPVWIGRGAGGVSTRLRLRIETNADRAAAESMFGSPASITGPAVVMPPIICLRSSKPLNLPQPYFFLAPDTSWEGWDHHAGGQRTMVDWTVTESAEPALGLLASPYSYEDIEVAYETYEDLESSNATYEELESRFEFSGVVP